MKYKGLRRWKAMLHIIADFVPCWLPEQLSALLHYIETSSCAKHFSASQRDFIALIKAVAKKDPARMAWYSKKLLEQKDANVLEADHLEYILSAGMLGDVSADNTREADLLWRQYCPLLPAEISQL